MSLAEESNLVAGAIKESISAARRSKKRSWEVRPVAQDRQSKNAGLVEPSRSASDTVMIAALLAVDGNSSGDNDYADSISAFSRGGICLQAAAIPRIPSPAHFTPRRSRRPDRASKQNGVLAERRGERSWMGK